ncbi:MAG: type II toxin-antitoxin system RelE/ParE family toxin [Anaerolineae bacterium]|nr:type II toxin-antitoxin system RelE/ParE family toxin [Anaerolineae bacterium]
MTTEQPVQVRFAPAFQKEVKRLRKRYPRIQQDIQPLIDQLIDGKTPGDQIQSTGYTVYKVRLPNRDAQRGKSGGYRVIYYIRTLTQIVLLTIYSKSDRSDTNTGDIQALIADLPDDSDESGVSDS